MGSEVPDSFDEQLKSMNEAETAEWSCRTLIRSLLQPSAGETADVGASLDYPRRILEAGADALLRQAAAIEDESERIDAFGDIEFLVEGVIRIAAEAPALRDDIDAMASPAPAPENETTSEIKRALKRRGGRPLGVRAPIIAALQKLFPEGDPVISEGMHREKLRARIAQYLDIPTDQVELKTVDRARKVAWANPTRPEFCP